MITEQNYSNLFLIMLPAIQVEQSTRGRGQSCSEEKSLQFEKSKIAHYETLEYL